MSPAVCICRGLLKVSYNFSSVPGSHIVALEGVAYRHHDGTKITYMEGSSDFCNLHEMEKLVFVSLHHRLFESAMACSKGIFSRR